MACMAALRHYRKPIVQIINNNDTNDDERSSDNNGSSTTTSSNSIPIILSPNIKEPTPLPLHHTPLSITFGLISSSDATIKNKNNNNSTTIPQIVSLMDPNSREELCCKGYFTIGLNIYNEICLFELYNGSIEIPPTQFRHYYHLATLQIPSLFASFEKSLEDANEQAMNDRLRLLKISTTNLPPSVTSTALPPLLDNSGGDGIPFFQARDNDELMNPIDNEDSTAIQNVIEEEYKRQALDYNLGHIATKIREDTKTKKGSNTNSNSNNSNKNKNSSLLLAALLQSVSSSNNTSQHQQIINPSNTKDIMDIENNDIDESTLQDEEQSMKKQPPNQQQQEPQQKKVSKTVHHDSEEEEEPIQIVSEFGGMKQEQQEEKSINDMKPSVDDHDDDDDVDDLAAAIKNKKKKKKSKK